MPLAIANEYTMLRTESGEALDTDPAATWAQGSIQIETASRPDGRLECLNVIMFAPGADCKQSLMIEFTHDGWVVRTYPDHDEPKHTITLRPSGESTLEVEED